MAFHPGDHYVICDMCGFRRHRSACRTNWKGFIVCADTCFEERHPQEYMVRPRPDRQAVRDARPEKTPVYIDTSVRPDWDSL